MTTRSRPRALRTVAVLVLLGAVVNVLVAWGCVIVAPTHLGPLLPSRGESDLLDRFFPKDNWPEIITDEDTMSRGGVTQISALGFAPRESSAGFLDNYKRATVWRSGWPCRSLVCAARRGSRAVPGGFRVQGLTSPMANGLSRPLPCTPEWPRFTINTIFYSAVLASGLVWFRWWRRQHGPGCCKRCGYDLKGNVSGVCPECGERT